MNTSPRHRGRLTLVLASVLTATLTGVGAPAAVAADVSASDGTSQVTITTPIPAPPTGACTRVPYAYVLAADVEVATAVIVDTNGQLVARSNQLLPGQGTGTLNVCGANLSGRTSPFTLQLQITYDTLSQRPAATVSSRTFGFAPRTVSCRKVTRPHRGTVQSFAAKTCPRGWTPARRA